MFPVLLFSVLGLTSPQQHDLKPAEEAMHKLSIFVGKWAGKQDFNTPGAPMIGDATNTIEMAVGGRYLAETLSTTLPGRKPSDTRHYTTFDAKTGKYKAWWFTDTTVGPMELDGTLENNKLTLLNHPAAGRPQLRFTYAGGVKSLVYTFEMEREGKWQLLFTTTYAKQ